MSLEFSLNHAAPASADVDCIIVGVFADKQLTAAGTALDSASEGRITALLERGDISGKTGKVTMLHDISGVTAPRVLVIGLGETAKFGVPQYIKAVADAARTLKTGVVASALLTLSEIEVKGRDAAWNIRTAIVTADHACYRYTATLGAKNKKRDETGLALLQVSGSDGAALAHGIAIAAGVAHTRELGNLPPNVCTPIYLAEQAQAFAAKNPGVECEILDDDAMEAIGMGSLLAVARASANRPRLVVLKYSNGGDAKPYVLVGKGITFDTGGLDLKPSESMLTMKRDMSGGAAVIAAMAGLADVGCPVRVIGLVPAAENSVSSTAMRPGDVIRHYGGRTSEVNNTDAEGRLVLADAMAYAVAELSPTVLVDVATLTGAMKVALGQWTGGFFANHEGVAAQIDAAGAASGENVWRMPLTADYEEKVSSKIADGDNAAGGAGAITAALFLQHFAGDVPWGHIDFASAAEAPTERHEWTAGPSGFGPRLLLTWLGADDPLEGIA